VNANVAKDFGNIEEGSGQLSACSDSYLSALGKFFAQSLNSRARKISNGTMAEYKDLKTTIIKL